MTSNIFAKPQKRMHDVFIIWLSGDLSARNSDEVGDLSDKIQETKM